MSCDERMETNENYGDFAATTKHSNSVFETISRNFNKNSATIPAVFSKEEFKKRVKDTFRDTLKTSGQLKHILA